MSGQGTSALQSRLARAAGKPRRGWPEGVGWVLAAALLLAGARATASVLVYHSDNANGIPIETVPVGMDASSTKSLELYIVRGEGISSPMGATICVDDTATGDETCGFELIIKAELDFAFTGFTAATLSGNDQIGSRMLLAGVKVTSGVFDELRVNGTNTVGLWDPVPLHFGTLDVSSGSDLGQASVVSGGHVGASGDASAP